MNQCAKIRIALDMSIKEKYKLLIGALIMTLVFFLMGFMLIIGINNKAYKSKVEKGIKVPIDKLGYYIFDVDPSLGSKVSDEIKELNCISAVGRIIAGGGTSFQCLDRLAEVQQGHKNFLTNFDDNCLEVYTVSPDFIDMMNIKITSGNRPTDYEFDDTTVLLYLSERYKKVAQVGDVYYEKYEGKIVYKFVVAGFFSDDSYILSQTFAPSTDEMLDSGYMSLDYGVIEVMDLNLTSGYFYSEEQFENVKTELKSISKKYGIALDMYDMASVVKYNNENTKLVLNATLEMVLLITIAVFTLMISIQIGRVMINSEEYGIWLANGATLKDISNIIIYQNIIYTIMPLVLGGTLLYFYLKNEWGRYKEMENYIRSTFIKIGIPSLVIIAVIIITLVSIVPIKLIKKKNTSEILKGETI